MSSRVQDRSLTKPSKSKDKSNNSSWKRTFTDENVTSKEDEFDEMKYCVICAEKIVLAAKSPCHHTTCHKCTFRQRSLYQKKACLVCRTENDRLIFTEELEKVFQDFNYQELLKIDPKSDIGFTSHHAYSVTMELLKFRCPNCGEESSSFTQYNDHLRSQHDRYLCTICTSNKKSFPSEFEIFTQKQLQAHQIRGNNDGFGGHPSCKFCKGKKFYSEDELTIHLRESHEKCHVCDQLDPSNPQYFKNYDALEEHFRFDHYICNVQVCLDKKFVVFPDELDLQAHMLAEHGNFGSNYVVGASNNNPRFRSQLSTFRPVKKNGAKTDNVDSIDTKRKRLEERARHYLNYSTSKFKKFLELNNNYRNNSLSVSKLKSCYEELFESATEDEIHLLLFDLSELYPKESSQHIELKKIVKLHEQRTKIETEFPALPGSSTSLAGTYGGATWNAGSKTKKQQKKTLEEDFPALPVSRTPTYTPVKSTVRYRTVIEHKSKPSSAVNVTKTPANYTFSYLNSNSSSSSTVSTTKPPKKLNEELFPALPQAPPKRVIPRVNPIPNGNGAWDTRPHTQPSSASSSSLNMKSLENALSETSTGSKKNKKKKQILFQMGGR